MFLWAIPQWWCQHLGNVTHGCHVFFSGDEEKHRVAGRRAKMVYKVIAPVQLCKYYLSLAPVSYASTKTMKILDIIDQSVTVFVLRKTWRLW